MFDDSAILEFAMEALVDVFVTFYRNQYEKLVRLYNDLVDQLEDRDHQIAILKHQRTVLQAAVEEGDERNNCHRAIINELLDECAPSFRIELAGMLHNIARAYDMEFIYENTDGSDMDLDILEAEQLHTM